MILVSSSCLKARQLFEEVRENYKKLSAIVPSGQYYRFNDHWRYVTQRLCFLAALTIFLEVGILVSINTVAEILGGKLPVYCWSFHNNFLFFLVKVQASEGFHLDLEDYLMGLLQLCSELVNICTVCNMKSLTWFLRQGLLSIQ